MSAEKVLSVLVSLAAVTMTALVARRELLPVSTAPRPVVETEYVKEWASYRDYGRDLGPQNPELRIVYFSEVECPFCKKFERSLQRLDSVFPGKIGRTFVHYPLPSHDAAYEAAVAVECAGAQGRFSEMLETLFSQQATLASVEWDSLAPNANLADTVAFQQCLKADWPKKRIDRGVLLGQQIGLRGTPTLFINGWRVVGSHPDSTLERIVRNVLHTGRPK